MSSDGSNSSLGQRRGLMLVLSSPSGAGKTTLSRRLLQTDPDIVMSVSATTRPPRPNEVEGQDYFFVSAQTFDAMLQAGAFLEHATVFGNNPPKPTPEMKRRINMVCRSGAATIRRLNKP